MEFPSKAAEAVYKRRGTFAAKCDTVEAATVEITRLMNGIDGFADCRVIEAKRLEDCGWSAVIDDPANDFEFDDFTIFDDGDMDWT